MSRLSAAVSGFRFASARFVRVPRASHTPPQVTLVSDSGDDYEMSGEFATTLLRFNDRLMGFLIGGAVLAAAWAAWSML